MWPTSRLEHGKVWCPAYVNIVCVCVWVCGCVGVWVCGCVGGWVGVPKNCNVATNYFTLNCSNGLLLKNKQYTSERKFLLFILFDHAYYLLQYITGKFLINPLPGSLGDFNCDKAKTSSFHLPDAISA